MEASAEVPTLVVVREHLLHEETRNEEQIKSIQSRRGTHYQYQEDAIFVITWTL